MDRILSPEVFEAISWLNEQMIAYHVEWTSTCVPAGSEPGAPYHQHVFRVFFADDGDGALFRLFHPQVAQRGRQHEAAASA